MCNGINCDPIDKLDQFYIFTEPVTCNIVLMLYYISMWMHIGINYGEGVIQA